MSSGRERKVMNVVDMFEMLFPPIVLLEDGTAYLGSHL